jgi:integrase
MDERSTRDDIPSESEDRADRTHMPTVREWFDRWLVQRTARGLKSPETYRTVFEVHVADVLGSQRLDVVRPGHVRALVANVTGASRTRRNTYYLLRGVFGAAVAAELIERSPCQLQRGELPPNKDAPGFDRQNAVFSAAELRRLLTAPEVEPEDRVFYALHALGAMRTGEAWGLTWSDYHTERRPLADLQIVRCWRSQLRRVHTTKNDQQREVPVIPTLGRILDAWWSTGWALAFGREPTLGDLIVPRVSGKGTLTYGDHRRQADRWARHLRDLGLRRRRIYDLRATGITLAQEAGAYPQILEYITHASSGVSTSHNGGRVLRGYSRFSWAARCTALLALERALVGSAQLSLFGGRTDD